MTRSRASAKQAGTRFESAIVAYLVSRGWRHAERRAKTGALDKGDITGIPGVVIEAKDLREAQVEAEHAGALVGAAWIKRRGKASPADAYVVMDGETFTHLLREAGY